MNLYDLFQKAAQEIEENVQNSQNFAKMVARYKQVREKRMQYARELLENHEITTEEFERLDKDTSRAINVAMEDLEEIYPKLTYYSERLARIKDCGVSISNKMLCNLLKTQTGEKWSYEIVEEGPHVAKLIFSNESGETFCTQKGILTQSGNLGYIIKKLENINWFQEYLNAKRAEGSELLETSLMTGQAGFMFPPFVQITLENFFKHIQVDINHPENLTLEERPVAENKEYKSHNLYYRYQRDKKAGKFDNPDGKNGK